MAQKYASRCLHKGWKKPGGSDGEKERQMPLPEWYNTPAATNRCIRARDREMLKLRMADRSLTVGFVGVSAPARLARLRKGQKTSEKTNEILDIYRLRHRDDGPLPRSRPVFAGLAPLGLRSTVAGLALNPQLPAQTLSATVIIKVGASDSTYERTADASFCKSCLAAIAQ
jgi:hypothetical protein